MLEILKMIVGITPPFNMIVLVTISVFAFMTVVGVAKEVRKFFCHREELEFKREMIAQGIAVEEVERLVMAGNKKRRSSKQDPTGKLSSPAQV